MTRTAFAWTRFGVLVAASAALWTAALMPQFYPVWGRSADALEIIATHATLWRINAVLFASSCALALIAVALLVARRHAHPLGTTSLTLMIVASTLWIAHNCYRASTMVEVARARDPARTFVHSLLQPWLDTLWLAAAVLLIVAFAALGLYVLATGATAAWAGWCALGSAALSLILLLAIREMPPIVAYLPLLPFTVAAFVEARRGSPDA